MSPSKGRLKTLEKLNFIIRELKVYIWASIQPQIEKIIDNKVVDLGWELQFSIENVNIQGHLKNSKNNFQILRT